MEFNAPFLRSKSNGPHVDVIDNNANVLPVDSCHRYDSTHRVGPVDHACIRINGQIIRINVVAVNRLDEYGRLKTKHTNAT